ncbi:glutathione S-transferase theta-1-like [Trachinotus anak]|uniref:glutathione S-transferase theta-1-like n=1 Tax=Trachinotus anak TaxID=443729 RepID=UPI0039F1F95F
MELYLDLVSPPCRSVFLFAKVVRVPFEFKLVDLAAGHQYSEEFGQISMIRKIPVMKDGSFILTESIAILKYLAQKYSSSVADHWFPADLQKQARVNEYLSWQHLNLRAHGSKVFLLKNLFPVIMDSEVPKERMDAAVEDLKQSVNLLEEKFLQNKPFIAGDKISLADLVAIIEIMQPVGSGVDVFEGRPKLVAWRERVKKQIGENLFDEAHEAIMSKSSLTQRIQNNTDLELLKPKFKKIFSNF